MKLGSKSSPGQPPPTARRSALIVLLLCARAMAQPLAADAMATRAVDAVHWSLQPLERTEVPLPHDRSWVQTPIDAFILTELEAAGLEPAPRADPRTLLRRATYDLIGLPPTPEEMATFALDATPDAFEKVIDRLLASPRYGERWARHWLDAVHYADTHGHDQDRPRPNAWPYRDYVIAAFNEDKPYARFASEQLAGDVLWPEDPQGIVATGFIAAGPWDESSQMHVMADTIDKQIAQNLDRDDMVTTTMSTFTSTTVHCARCHDHKFDPVSQAEHYALQACFAGVDRAERPYDAEPELNGRRQDLLRQKRALSAKTSTALLALADPALQDEIAAWEKNDAWGAANWTVVDAVTATSSAGVWLEKQADGSILSTGPRPERDTYTITAAAALPRITAVRLEVLTRDDEREKGPGRQENGNLHLSEFRVQAGDRTLRIRDAIADFNQDGWTITHAIDGDPKTAWGIHPETGRPHVAVFELAEPVSAEQLTFVIEQLHGGHHLIARPRLSVTASPPPFALANLPGDIASIVRAPARERSADRQRALAAWFLGHKIDAALAALPPPLLVYGAASDFPPNRQFKPARVPRPVFLLRRGEVTQPGAEARPGALGCVPGLASTFELDDPDDEGSRRAALAKWITDPRNVLTWRSIVNRVWHHHFGRGIVDSPNDFGRMGSAPSHRELLDWLAVDFRDHGGSFKRLHKQVLMSAAWQQSSRHDPVTAEQDAAEKDADNRRLWRMNRTRLDAEQVRDSILAVSGKLDLTMGGPPVKQFAYDDPNPDVTPKVDYHGFDPDHPDSFRRSIYRFLFRTLPDPFMDTLDCADGSQLTPVRNVSVTALQAMVLMNDRFVVRQSEHIAARCGEQEGIGPQVVALYRLALQRPPTPEELRSVSDYATKHGMANACRMILNCSEFSFVD